MTEIPERKTKWMMVYPGKGWRKQFMKMPLRYWRMGLGPILQRWFLVLTTTGRKSGQPRHTMLEYSVMDGKTYLGSGWGERPDWCQNIAVDPRVTIQSKGGAESAIARRVTSDEEMARLYHAAKAKKSPVWKQWLEARGIEDNEEDWVAKKDRLAIFRMDPTSEKTPAPMKTDLVWVWAVIAIVMWLIWLMAV
ncbi:MAG: nitroreductase family deazaflavin-dependent oxidoreductase [Acidobacteria bacterium]|nr:nitroreductase family deazaflavin-dependent oxidoreductase [Acidobacteriota bacterium]